MSSAATTSWRFDAHTALRDDDPAGLSAEIDPGWSGYLGAHGGYVAAIALRAAAHAVRAEDRPVRSLVTHLHAAVKDGELALDARCERAGRSLSGATVRATQGGATVATASAIFGAGGRDVRHADAPMPDVPPPEQCTPLVDVPVPQARAADHVEHRPAREPLPLTGGDRAEILVWMRLGEPRPVDALLATFLVDSGPPALYGTLDAYVPMPTVELSIHYTATEPSTDPWVLGVFRSALAGDGYASEDGELWTPAGALLLRARQLRRVLG